jgi:hypothetical protein
MSGFLELPDISFMNGISGLNGKCRECQVSVGEESSQDSEQSIRQETESRGIRPAFFLVSDDVHTDANLV